MNAEQLTQMQHMLSGCLNPDNAARTAAEKLITNHLNQHRELFIFGLINLLRSSPQADVRVLSAIILRQTLPQGEDVLFIKLSEQLQATVKTELLQAILHEPERYVRTQISDTVAALAGALLHLGKWPDLLPALFNLCQPNQGTDALKVCALSILGKLSDAADNLLNHIPALHGVFVSTLQPSNSLLVRQEACVACCKVIPIIEVPGQTKEYQKLTPLFLSALGDALTASDEDAAKRILAGLTEVATEEGKFFQPRLAEVVQAMYVIGADTLGRHLEDGTRQYACEVLIGMAESASPMVRKSPSFIKYAILVGLSLMLDVEEDPHWGHKQDSTDFYDNSNFDCGEMSLDRLAEAVKGAKLWPVLQPILEQFVSDKQNWKMRHAGLFALAQTAAVIPFDALPVKEVCAFVRSDPHPRVRYAAVQVLGQLPVDFEVITQNKHHKILFPTLMEPLKDFAHPRVQMHAASALLMMVDGSEPKILKRYLAPLMELLVTLLKSSHQMVQEQVMPVMAALSCQASAQFLVYYDTVVPLMKHIIQHACTKETRKLRAKAMESVTYIGMYSGKEKFHADAMEIMHMFQIIMQQSAVATQAKAARKQAGQPAVAASSSANGSAPDDFDDDYSQQHMLQAWTRICSCLGEEFVPVLPYVMPQVFEAITKKSESEQELDSRVHKLVDDEGNELEHPEGGDDEDHNVDKHGHVKGISATAHRTADETASGPNVLHYTSFAHTAAMEDKSMALSMLCSFCHDLRGSFLPYIKKSAEIMIPLLTHPHDEVQAHAIAGMPHLFKAAVDAHSKGTASLEFVQAVLEAILTQLVAVFPLEVDAQTLQTLVSALHDCVDEAGPLARHVIGTQALNDIGHALLKMLTASHERIARREALLKKEDEEGDLDEERIVEVESRNASEDGLNSIVAACIETLIKSHGELFLPVFDSLFPEVMRMLSVNSVSSTKKIAVFIIDDVIEHLSAYGATKYFPHVLEAMCMYATDEKEEHGLRQACAYGLGVAAKHGGPAFAPFKGEIVKRCVASLRNDPAYLVRNEKYAVGRPFEPTSSDDEGADDLEADAAAAAAEGGDDDDEGEGEEEEVEDDEDDDAEDDRSRFAALDNLVSSLGTIATDQNEPTLLPVWLSFLPLRVDESEAVPVYTRLLDLVEGNSAALLGAQMENLPRVIAVLLKLQGTTMLKNAALRARVNKVLVSLRSMPPPMLQQLAATLPKEEQEKLAAILQGQ